ncbi:uncharacterized protein LOC129728891 [Wyeomyia smithii]|uniref:uncharacterized protein LOC129728891 n=1 Tax=Wyeomyia smithii TaxID=174621 RepID=UPI002467BA45|nr:uncharacterized protein LOC129728891 [Wyeomyia smithii]
MAESPRARKAESQMAESRKARKAESQEAMSRVARKVEYNYRLVESSLVTKAKENVRCQNHSKPNQQNLKKFSIASDITMESHEEQNSSDNCSCSEETQPVFSKDSNQQLDYYQQDTSPKALPEASIVYSRKNKEMLNIEGYLYNLDKKKNQRYYWDCARRSYRKQSNCSCRARAITFLRENTHEVVSHGNHDHPANPIDCLENEYRYALKRRAIDCSDVPSKIIREVSCSMNPIVQTRASKQAQKMVELLSNADYWMCDGTFKTAPTGFSQMYTFHGLVGSGQSQRVIPLVYFLLGRKCQKTYATAFEALSDVLSDNRMTVKCEYILSDFKKAALNALREVFPMLQSFGCYFHFTQNIMKHLTLLGLKSAYSMNINLYMSTKKICALSFLLHSRIGKAYKELKPTLQDIPKTFFEYFEETYILGKNENGRPLFPPALWSNYKAVRAKIPRSTNLLEAWHRRWTVLVGTNHVSLSKIITEIRKEQHETEGIILQIKNDILPAQSSVDSRKKDQLIFEKCSNLNKSSNLEFLCSLSLCLAAKTKRM